MKTTGLAVKVVFEDPGVLDMGVYNLGVTIETERLENVKWQVLTDVATRKPIAATLQNGNWSIKNIEQSFSRVFITAAT